MQKANEAIIKLIVFNTFDMHTKFVIDPFIIVGIKNIEDDTIRKGRYCLLN
jgi:hypothetical protein